MARLVWLLLGGCSALSSSGLAIDGVDPAVAPNTMDIALKIEGSGFHLPITSDLDNGTTVVGTMAVTVGDTVLPDAALRSNQLIEGTVPAGLAEGSYDVTLTIGDRSDVLVAGYTVIDPVTPLHLAPGDAMPGSGPLTLTGSVSIDTDTPSITVSLPIGDSFDVHAQLGGGPDLAVLHVGALTVDGAAEVKVTGARPLVIVAGGDVQISGLLDAGGHGTTPGPGGAVSGMGGGAGAGGIHEATDDSDSGGGGGGYGGAGANGGDISGTCIVAPGTGGAAFGDAAISQLVAGSGGASSSGTGCPTDPGGGGGGALQITSATSIAINTGGVINAGGGGGTGGTDCNAASGDVNSAAGGGSGGSIVLQAPLITNGGVIAANGGGGGGSSQTSAGSGMSGQDGQPSATAASGGTGPRANGGAGGIGSAAPVAGGGALCGANAAGGGGGVGRIAVSAGFGGTGTTSPTPATSLRP